MGKGNGGEDAVKQLGVEGKKNGEREKGNILQKGE